MTKPRYRTLIICSHPVQYMSPLLRRMARHPQIDLQVAYCSLRGAHSAYDPDFATAVQWDVPLLDGYNWVEIPNIGTGTEAFLGLCNPGLWRIIRRGSFDAVFCHTGYLKASFWIAFLASKLSRTAFLFGTDTTSLSPRDSRRWKIAVKKIVWPGLFRLADQVIVPSSASVALMRTLGIPPERITLTPFVVDNDWWTEKSKLVDRDAVRSDWGVTSGQQVILFCAKLQPWKRPADLLRAFSSLNLSNAILVFAGEGPLRAQLEAEAKKLGVASRVRFLGFVNQSRLPAVYTSADLFVISSGYDPCPVVVCEAMLCGLPVVLSDQIRGRFDLVRPGETGDIFPCGDINALAASIQKLLSSAVALAEMKLNALRRMATWSPQENVGATVEAIRIAKFSKTAGKR
ncbi:MAG: glycosyltransferase family 1 protein [Acidobacteria bacterium]|nr:MAG: glycosyltransferase family 1 protein [Acidobacteriota bacterium]